MILLDLSAELVKARAEIERLQVLASANDGENTWLLEQHDKCLIEIYRLRADNEHLNAVDLARAKIRDRLETENARLRAALEEVYQSVKPLLPDGWSDAGHVMNVIVCALKEGEKK